MSDPVRRRCEPGKRRALYPLAEIDGLSGRAVWTAGGYAALARTAARTGGRSLAVPRPSTARRVS
jgi:hypothetical protein